MSRDRLREMVVREFRCYEMETCAPAGGRTIEGSQDEHDPDCDALFQRSGLRLAKAAARLGAEAMRESCARDAEEAVNCGDADIPGGIRATDLPAWMTED